jgi:hypothetical protein
MKQALEALEGCRIDYDYHGNPMDISDIDVLNAIESLSQAIEQAEKQDVEQSSTESKETFDQPVAWMSSHDVGFKRSEFGDTPTVPLYTTPQPQREWVGLTNEEIQFIYADSGYNEIEMFASAIEQALKEKNT